MPIASPDRKRPTRAKPANGPAQVRPRTGPRQRRTEVSSFRHERLSLIRTIWLTTTYSGGASVLPARTACATTAGRLLQSVRPAAPPTAESNEDSISPEIREKRRQDPLPQRLGLGLVALVELFGHQKQRSSKQGSYCVHPIIQGVVVSVSDVRRRQADVAARPTQEPSCRPDRSRR